MVYMHPERSFQVGGFSHMEAHDKYREFAAECERLAKQAKSDHHGKVLREMAEVWRKLADVAAQRS
jgi:hypothetical protein